MYEFLDYRVQDVMSQPVTIRADATLAQAEELLEKNGFNALPVVDANDALVGLISSLDLLKAFAENPNRVLSRDCMVSTWPLELNISTITCRSCMRPGLPSANKTIAAS